MPYQTGQSRTQPRGKRRAEFKEEQCKLAQKRFDQKVQQRCANYGPPVDESKQSLQTVTMQQRYPSIQIADESTKTRQTLDEPAEQMLWEPQTLQALDEPAGIWCTTYF